MHEDQIDVPDIHQAMERYAREDLPDDKSLLDVIFKKENEEMSVYMDSMPCYD